jgi:anti-anti-sigma regulatory factor
MLSIHSERIDDVAVIECTGRIVQSKSAFALRDAVTLQDDARVILLDLSGVSAIEGGGLGMLLFLQRWAYDHDIQFKLFNPNRSVWERLQMANSLPDFEIASPHEIQAVLSNTHLHSTI